MTVPKKICASNFRRKKQRRNSPMDLFALADALAHSLGFLNIKEINRTETVSRRFLKRCKEALNQIHEFDLADQDLQLEDPHVILGALLKDCPNLLLLRTRLPTCSDFVASIMKWQKLCSLSIINTSPVFSVGFQHTFIPLIAKTLVNLEELFMESVFSVDEVNIRPLKSLRNLSELYFYAHNTKQDEQKLVGLESVIENCPIFGLGVDMSCNFFDLLEKSDPSILKNIEMLFLTAPPFTRLNCETLAEKMPNLTVLQLVPVLADETGIQMLTSLTRLQELELNFTSVTALGISYLLQPGNFPDLKEFCCSGLLTDPHWPKLMAAVRPGLNVKVRD